MHAEERELLTRFARDRSEDAFRSLVDRYTDFVYGAALRRLGDHHKAQDAVQSTFIIFAKRATTMSRNVMLGGWLYRTASLVCNHMMREEARRKRREAAAVRTELPAKLKEESEAAWAFIQPLLDKALDALSPKSREAVVARYLLDKSPGEIAAELGISEKTAWARIDYGTRKLRERLTALGVKVTGAVLVGAFAAKSAEAAPAGLAAGVHAAAWGAATGGALSGASALISAKVMRLMWWAKVKVVAACATATLAAVSVAAPVARRLARPPVAGPSHFLSPGGRSRDPGFWKTVRDEPGVRGVARIYRWDSLESEPGVYDFAELEADLAAVAAAGKQLIVGVDHFGNPWRPRSVPAYLTGEPYGGGVYRGRRGGDGPVLWHPAVRERLRALIAALGARFDGDPRLAAFIAPRLALEIWPVALKDQAGVAPFSLRGFLETARAHMAALHDHFPRTVTFQALDWLPGNPRQGVAELADQALALGVGLSCGYAFLDNPSLTQGLYAQYPRLAGRVPLALYVSWTGYDRRHSDGRPVTAEDLFVFARDELHVDVLIWAMDGERFDGEILPLLRRQGAVAARAGAVWGRDRDKDRG